MRHADGPRTQCNPLLSATVFTLPLFLFASFAWGQPADDGILPSEVGRIEYVSRPRLRRAPYVTGSAGAMQITATVRVTDTAGRPLEGRPVTLSARSGPDHERGPAVRTVSGGTATLAATFRKPPSKEKIMVLPCLEGSHTLCGDRVEFDPTRHDWVDFHLITQFGYISSFPLKGAGNNLSLLSNLYSGLVAPRLQVNLIEGRKAPLRVGVFGQIPFIALGRHYPVSPRSVFREELSGAAGVGDFSAGVNFATPFLFFEGAFNGDNGRFDLGAPLRYSPVFGGSDAGGFGGSGLSIGDGFRSVDSFVELRTPNRPGGKFAFAQGFNSHRYPLTAGAGRVVRRDDTQVSVGIAFSGRSGASETRISIGGARYGDLRSISRNRVTLQQPRHDGWTVGIQHFSGTGSRRQTGVGLVAGGSGGRHFFVGLNIQLGVRVF